MTGSPDVIVVGGGVMGLLAARELRLRGRKVVVLDKGRIGGEASWASAGMVGSPPPGDPSPLARLESLSREAYPGLAATLLSESAVDIEFLSEGWLSLAWNEDQARALEKADAGARGLGQDSLMIDGALLWEMEPALSKNILAARLLPGGQVENRLLVKALEIAEAAAGTGLRPGVEVLGLEAGTVPSLLTRQGKMPAPLIVLAAGAWSGALAGLPLKVPVIPQRGQILSFRPEGRPLKRVILEAEDFPYLASRRDGRTLVGATREFQGFDRSLTREGISGLLETAVRVAPGLGGSPLLETWTGFRPMSKDGLPLIGSAGLPGVFLLTGHGPSGVGPAPASAALLAALATGEQPALDPAPFDPARFA